MTSSFRPLGTASVSRSVDEAVLVLLAGELTDIVRYAGHDGTSVPGCPVPASPIVLCLVVVRKRIVSPCRLAAVSGGGPVR